MTIGLGGAGQDPFVDLRCALRVAAALKGVPELLLHDEVVRGAGPRPARSTATASWKRLARM